MVFGCRAAGVHLYKREIAAVGEVESLCFGCHLEICLDSQLGVLVNAGAELDDVPSAN